MLINHNKRREEIADATRRVIITQGVTAVSIRNVAQEAGISTSSLRHVLPTRDELIAHTMQVMEQRAWERVQRHLEISDIPELVRAVIRELLPLDDERRAEMQVSAALVSEATSSARIRQVRDESYKTLRDGCKRMITLLREAGFTDPDLDVGPAATALHGLLDGLATHMLIDTSPSFHQEALQLIDASINNMNRNDKKE